MISSTYLIFSLSGLFCSLRTLYVAMVTPPAAYIYTRYQRDSWSSFSCQPALLVTLIQLLLKFLVGNLNIDFTWDGWCIHCVFIVVVWSKHNVKLIHRSVVHNWQAISYYNAVAVGFVCMVLQMSLISISASFCVSVTPFRPELDPTKCLLKLSDFPNFPR